MKKRIAMMLALLASVTSAQASLLDVSTFYCQGGELSVSTGTTFIAHCAGHLYIDRTSVIRADELISISSGGNLTLWGTLVAPRIQLISNADLSVGGGLFSGSPDFLPEVAALSHASSENAHLRTFGDIVLNPIIDPVYGAVMITQMSLPDPIFFESIVIENVFLLTDESVVPVPIPEPRMALLMGVGALMLFMSRHRKRGCRESVPDLRGAQQAVDWRYGIRSRAATPCRRNAQSSCIPAIAAGSPSPQSSG